MLHDFVCPACGTPESLRGHGKYSKYHTRKTLTIRRVRCTACGVTHALIPRFSLPNTSHDTASVELYLRNRSLGMSRVQAGLHILLQGFAITALKRLETAFNRCCNNWHALFGPDDVASVRGYTDAAPSYQATSVSFFALNCFALGRHVNAVFNSRYTILLFKTHTTGYAIPHNPVSVQSSRVRRDSS